MTQAIKVKPVNFAMGSKTDLSSIRGKAVFRTPQPDAASTIPAEVTAVLRQKVKSGVQELEII
jgi:hypothetical protein